MMPNVNAARKFPKSLRSMSTSLTLSLHMGNVLPFQIASHPLYHCPFQWWRQSIHLPIYPTSLLSCTACGHSATTHSIMTNLLSMVFFVLTVFSSLMQPSFLTSSGFLPPQSTHSWHMWRRSRRGPRRAKLLCVTSREKMVQVKYVTVLITIRKRIRRISRTGCFSVTLSLWLQCMQCMVQIVLYYM